MFFSRLTLKENARENPGFLKVFGRPYQLHQSVWELFGDRADRQRDFLYRLDKNGNGPMVYTVSKREPELDHSLWKVETKKYEPKILSGWKLGFMLRVNPVRKRDGKRHDVVMDAKQKLRSGGRPKDEWPSQAQLAHEEGYKWLESRSKDYGFKVQGFCVKAYQVNEFTKQKEKRNIRYSTCDMEGNLMVRDPSLFLDTLKNGIGPAKAFGCGLMLVRRV